MIAWIQIFFGIALAYAGISTMMDRGDVNLVSVVACFLAIILIMKGATRATLWLSHLLGGPLQ